MNKMRAGLLVFGATMGFWGCQTVPYNPATSSDATPPKLGLRVDASRVVISTTTGRESSVGVGHFEAGERVVGDPNNVLGEVPMDAVLDVSAIAGDNETGIQKLTLMVNRTVYFRNSSGTLSPNLYASQVLKSIERPSSTGQVPGSAIAAIRTSIAEERTINDPGRTRILGTGVVLQYFAECKNYNGQTTYSKSITLRSGLIQE